MCGAHERERDPSDCVRIAYDRADFPRGEMTFGVLELIVLLSLVGLMCPA